MRYARPILPGVSRPQADSPRWGYPPAAAGSDHLDRAAVWHGAGRTGGREEMEESMNPKHTPGPWRSRAVGDYVYLDAGNWSALARVVVRVDGEPAEEGEANARLIAAAPDLLEALKAINDAFQWNEQMARPVFDKVHAAIAKAEGRE